MGKYQTRVAIDVGTSKIVVLVGVQQEGGNRIEIIGVGEYPSNGIRAGVVSDIEEATSSISSAISNAERMSDVSINSAFVSIGGAHIQAVPSKGVIAIPKDKNEITDEDIARVIEDAKSIALPSNTEILHLMTKEFIVDGQRGVKDPRGMKASRLEVETLIVYGSTSALNNLSKCFFHAGIDVEEYIATPIAASWGVLEPRQKELGVAVVDIGARCTSLAIFEEESLLHCAVLPIGAGHITNDIAIGLRTSIDIAEKVKIQYGNALVEEISDREKINLAKIDPKEKGEVSRKHVAEIIEARLLEIFSMVRKEIKKAKRDKLLPAGVILTGGGAKLPGMVELAKRELELPAQIGFPKLREGIIDKLDDPSYCVSIGTLLWGFEKKEKDKILSLSFLNSLKKFLRSFLP